MMRKLAVTVFALSLAALGCGSDSGTKTDGPVTPALDGGKTDTTVPVDGVADAPIGAETQVALDTASVESQQALDQAQSLDQAATLDTSTVVDAHAVDGIKPVDGGVDTHTPVDSGAVDSGSVDGGSAG